MRNQFSVLFYAHMSTLSCTPIDTSKLNNVNKKTIVFGIR